MLTRSGLGVAVAAVVLGICGFWWHYEELVVAASAGVIALAASLWTSRIGHHARISWMIPAPRVARGDPIRTIYRARNDSRRRQLKRRWGVPRDYADYRDLLADPEPTLSALRRLRHGGHVALQQSDQSVRGIIQLEQQRDWRLK